MVGYRGVTGVSCLLGENPPTHQSIVLLSGRALRIPADDLRRIIADQLEIRHRLLRYVQALIVHGVQPALCGVRHELEQSLACWLCLARYSRYPAQLKVYATLKPNNFPARVLTPVAFWTDSRCSVVCSVAGRFWKPRKNWKQFQGRPIVASEYRGASP